MRAASRHGEPGTPTLDQLRVFLAVVETGSFAAAARRLGRATSVISYAVANLEAQLGLALFDREATRKPQLTVAGRALLGEARTVAHGVDGLRARVRGLLSGLEAEVNLAVDVMLPTSRVVDAFGPSGRSSRPWRCGCTSRRWVRWPSSSSTGPRCWASAARS